MKIYYYSYQSVLIERRSILDAGARTHFCIDL